MLYLKHSTFRARYATFLLDFVAFQKSNVIADENPPSKPNVILFLVDDMG